VSSHFLTLPGNREDVAAVDALIAERLDTGDSYLTRIATHLSGAGGKRLRPLMAVTAAKLFCGTTRAPGDAIKAAAACELVHLGSLYHDDVMDESAERRGVRTVNAEWGNLQAIVAGDFMLAKASELAAELGAESARTLAETIGRLCRGQIGEVRANYDVTRSVADYLSSIEGKTASLFEAAARLGARCGGGNDFQTEAAAKIANSYGMVFQIVDDVLDLVGAAVGKPAGHDIAEGVYTLPALLLLGRNDLVARQLRQLLEQRDVTAAAELIRGAGGVEQALAVADEHARGAEGLTTGNQPARAILADAARTLLYETRRTLGEHGV